eukprot:127473-Chlamydomonas_euryale.AAC.1
MEAGAAAPTAVTRCQSRSRAKRVIWLAAAAAATRAATAGCGEPRRGGQHTWPRRCRASR